MTTVTVLLLNATFEPLRLIDWKKAVVMVLDGDAEMLEGDVDDPVRSARLSLPRPKVIRLRNFVAIPYRARTPLNRRAVLARDKNKCAYQGQPRKRTDPQCTGTATTIDHVQPRSRKGKHRWENTVASCSHCNALKDSYLLSEIGWELSFQPFAPHGTRWLILGFGVAEVDPAWEPYISSVEQAFASA